MSPISREADLVIIGSGAAGLACAITAMEAGVGRIVVLEKSPFTGGNSRMAGGHMVCTATDDKPGTVGTAEETFREVIRFHHYRQVEPRILRRFLDNTRGNADFLERLGFPCTPDGGGLVDGIYPFGNFKKVTVGLKRRLLEAGQEVRLNTAATKLERAEDGAHWLVHATSADEGELIFRAGAVLIATGGFTGNSELLHRYFPADYDDNYYTDALPLSGDGIALAEGAGAALAPYCTLVKENAYSCHSRLDAPNRAAHQTCSLWVNSRGERFHDESDTFSNESANSLVRQPGKIGYALFDENILSTLEALFREHLKTAGPVDPDAPPDFAAMMAMDINVFAAEHLRESLEGEWRRGDGWVFRADTPEELAAQLGIRPERLLRTIEEYNADCAAGHDSLFGRPAKTLIPLTHGPYYALKFRPILIDTQGPIVISENMEVLDEAHDPIPGLYAAGVCTSGSQGEDYCLHGANLSYALFSGRFAGRYIASYLGA